MSTSLPGRPRDPGGEDLAPAEGSDPASIKDLMEEHEQLKGRK